MGTSGLQSVRTVVRLRVHVFWTAQGSRCRSTHSIGPCVSTFLVLRLSAAAMAKQEPTEEGVRGVVINTASIAAYEGQIGQSDYSAAKGGVVGLTLVAARDLAAVGIRVMAIAPGTFFTPAFKMPEVQAQEVWGKAVPFPRRMGRPAEYAELVASIVSNDYLNGEVIRIDGAQRFGPK
jgi:NAD(P)-dependent dehydrogenase (short-subunit alcohol dehydrogenase family)